MTTVIVLIFVIGYLFIAFEGYTKVNKSAIALLMSVLCWVALMQAAPQYINQFHSVAFNSFQSFNPGATESQFMLSRFFSEDFADTCETVFFLMGAMTIVEVIDSCGAFSFVNRRLASRNATRLMWKMIGITFLLSAILDNMTTSIVMIMVLRCLVADKRQRMMFAGLVIIAANAGGAFSPIGDVTTIMLWINGNVTAGKIVLNTLVPSLACAVAAGLCVQPLIKGDIKASTEEEFQEDAPRVSRKVKVTIFTIGVLGLVFVPVFHTLTGLPPFVGILGSLSILWITTELIIRRHKSQMNRRITEHVSTIVKRIDMSTLLFFLGILLTVDAVKETGALSVMGTWLNTHLGNPYALTGIIGAISSVIDNVPLVASSIAMYPIQQADVVGELQQFVQDGHFWNLLAYCAGTGGSLLIIGSAAGVVVMGLEKISFGWYMKHFTWVATVSYLAGLFVFWLQTELF